MMVRAERLAHAVEELGLASGLRRGRGNRRQFWRHGTILPAGTLRSCRRSKERNPTARNTYGSRHWVSWPIYTPLLLPMSSVFPQISEKRTNIAWSRPNPGGHSSSSCPSCPSWSDLYPRSPLLPRRRNCRSTMRGSPEACSCRGGRKMRSAETRSTLESTKRNW